MQLTVLGCAGTFPGPNSPCSSYLIEHEGFRLVLDLGAGALGQLQRHIGLLDVDAIYVSHLHTDHCIDLIAYSYALRYHPSGAARVVPVYGPAGTRQRIVAAYETPPTHGLLDVFDFREIAVGHTEIGPFSVDTVRTNHPVECHAIRVSAGGTSVTYSGDTGECPELIELAKDTDLFLCEASWTHDPSSPPGVHLSGQQAGEHAQQAHAQRLVLTHVVAWTDAEVLAQEAAATFSGPIELASCGAVYRL